MSERIEERVGTEKQTPVYAFCVPVELEVLAATVAEARQLGLELAELLEKGGYAVPHVGVATCRCCGGEDEHTEPDCNLNDE